MNIMYYMIFFMYFSGLFVYIVSFKHFLYILLSLEFLSLSIFLNLFFSLNMELINLFFSLIFLTMIVCEGVLGLSIMVMMIRSSGNDNIMSLSLLW